MPDYTCHSQALQYRKLMKRYSRSTEERHRDEEAANRDLEIYDMNCAVVMSGEQGEVEGREG
jgi:hypothetical protein